MNVPTYIDDKFVDDKGYLTATWKVLLQQLLQNLQGNIGPEGLVAPSQTAANITTIATVPVNGTILYDSTNDQFKGIIGGVVKTFTLT